MEIDRRELLTGLAATTAAAMLPALPKASAALPEVLDIEFEQRIAYAARVLAEYRAAVRAGDQRRLRSRRRSIAA